MTASGLTLFELAGANSELRFSPHCWKTPGSSAIPVAHFVNTWADAAVLPAIARLILLDIYN
jgi:hypothetical protein